MNTFGERLNYLRLILGLSQEELALIVQVNISYISMLENNKNKPSDMFVSLLSVELNISKDWLLTGEGPMRTELDNRLKKEKASFALETGIGLETVGKRIRFARIYREVPASQLNRMLLTTKDDYLFALESGKKQPTAEDIKVISRNVGASEEWLLTGKGQIYFFEKGGIFSPMAGAGEPEIKMVVCAEGVAETVENYMVNGFKEGIEDKELNDLIQGIKSFWSQSSDDVRTWFKVQFKRTFPEVDEFKNKRR